MYETTSKLIIVISFLCMKINPSSLQILSQNENRPISMNDRFWNFRNSMRSLSVASSIPQPAFSSPVINGASGVVSKNVLQLAHDIGEILLENSMASSEVFSPLSISGALSLLLLGANGGTYNELMKLMQFNQDFYLNENPWKIHEQFGSLIETLTRRDQSFEKKPPMRVVSSWNEDERRIRDQQLDNEVEHRITVANGLFVQEGFPIRSDYNTAVTQTYNSKLKTLDFLQNGNAAVQYINEWVKYKTEGKIPQVLSASLSSDTKVVIASVLHFRAMWERTFLEGGTTPRPFYPDGTDKPSITVDMMSHGGSFPYYDAREYNCRILGLPYKHNLTTMYIILPNDSNRKRLREIQSYLTADKIDEMISKMKMATVAVLFPKMHISNEINLKSIFRKLGVTTLFDQYEGDLSLISNGLESFGWSQDWSSFPSLTPLAPFPTIPPLAPVQPLEAFSAPIYRRPYDRFNFGPRDDSQDDPYIFSRLGEDSDQANVTSLDNSTAVIDVKLNNATDVETNVTHDIPKTKIKREVTYKVTASKSNENDRLRFKDYIISKRISKLNPDKKLLRGKRQATSYQSVEALKNLDRIRSNLARTPNINPGLYAQEIIHKVDLTVNEKGTDGGAATVTFLYRTGTDAVFRVDTPFIFIIRNDETKLPLFYGTVYQPTNY